MKKADNYKCNKRLLKKQQVQTTYNSWAICRNIWRKFIELSIYTPAGNQRNHLVLTFARKSIAHSLWVTKSDIAAWSPKDLDSLLVSKLFPCLCPSNMALESILPITILFTLLLFYVQYNFILDNQEKNTAFKTWNMSNEIYFLKFQVIFLGYQICDLFQENL